MTSRMLLVSARQARVTIPGCAGLQAAVLGVPFVDALTTERDPTLPLAVGEWEEWGAVRS